MQPLLADIHKTIKVTVSFLHGDSDVERKNVEQLSLEACNTLANISLINWQHL